MVEIPNIFSNNRVVLATSELVETKGRGNSQGQNVVRLHTTAAQCSQNFSCNRT